MHALTTVPRASRMMWRIVLGLLVTIVAIVLTASVADAHPLGNFTVNRYARVELSAGVVRVYYVLDEAEIPAFQDREALHADREHFAAHRLDDIVRHLTLTVNGQTVPLVARDHLLTEPPGQGGLPTLRLAATLEAALPTISPSAVVEASLTDGNEPERIGWREIIIAAKGDTRLMGSTAPAVDTSDELRQYPANLIQA